MHNDIGPQLYINGLSYGIGNEVSYNSGNNTWTIGKTTQNATADVGALKEAGTYDTALGLQLFRSESRIDDSSIVTFKWGKVYVEDTSLGEPIREVMLNPGLPTDSNGWPSHAAIRDSLFQTEWFNWPVSAEIKYQRLMLFPEAGTLSYKIDTAYDTSMLRDSTQYDTLVKYDTIPADTLENYFEASDTSITFDTVYDSTTQTNVVDTVATITDLGLDSTAVIYAAQIDSATVIDSVYLDSTIYYDTAYDTIPGTFTIDSTGRTDSGFIGQSISMKYTVQLIHANGHIDTVETLLYDPYDSIYIWPKTVTIAHAAFSDDTVMLRVVGDFSGIPDDDTDVGFAREQMLDNYPSWADTTIAIDSGGIIPPPDTCFFAAGPYANPSTPDANDVSILVHYCSSGQTISAQVYDNLGNPIGAPSTYTSDEQAWDRIPIHAPGTAGTYYIVVTVGSYSKTLGYSVY